MMILKRKIVVSLLIASFSSTVVAADKRVWINVKPGNTEAVAHALQKSQTKIHYRFNELSAFAVSLPEQAIAGLVNNPNVLSIEEDAKRFKLADEAPYGIDAVGARDVWDSNRDGIIDSGAATGANKMICIIDSGLKTNHEDFSGVNVVGGYPADTNPNDGIADGWNQDDCGHGTHVAGTITAAKNDLGVIGVTPGSASLFIVKVFGGESCAWTYSSDLVNAAQKCVDAGASIINMSLGGSLRVRAEEQAFKQWYSANNILAIAAAGNDGTTAKSYPASYPSVISVAAIDKNNNLASFSQRNSEVELAAPGVAVKSTVPWLAQQSASIHYLDALGVSQTETYHGGNVQGSAATTGTQGSLVNGSLCSSTGNWSNQIVLCQRGSITFADKVKNAQNSGAAGVIIYNNVAGDFAATLGDGVTATIPAITLSKENGEFLLNNRLNQVTTLVSHVEKNASGYESWDGTSMATPHVSGVAALVWSAKPDASNAQLRTALTSTAQDLGSVGRDSSFGFGLVNAKRAIDYLNNTSVNQPPVADFTYLCNRLSCSFFGASSYDPEGKTLTYHWNFGNGKTATGSQVSQTYRKAGTYLVTLTVTDLEGASNSKTLSIKVSSQ